MSDVSTTLPGTDPLVGRTLDEKYYVEERLGAGGMGKVYRARHLSMDRPVAIKFLHQRFSDDVARTVTENAKTLKFEQHGFGFSRRRERRWHCVIRMLFQ